MDKKFVYPGVYAVISDATNFTTDSDAQFTINTKRILNSSDLPNGGSDPVVVSNTATLDVGTITTMTVRGASTTTVPLTFSKFGRVVTMDLPQLLLTAQSGAATQIHLAGTGIPQTYRPSVQQNFSIAGVNNTVTADVLVVVLSTGDIWIQIYAGTAFTTTFGTKETTFSWISAN